MAKDTHYLFRLIPALLLLLSQNLLASSDTDIAFILNAKNPPKGVIFEVAESEQDALTWALPRIQSYTQDLHNKYPNMKIAIVTHGTEQFALLSENEYQYRNIHKVVKHLVNENIPVHICGTHASWYDKDAMDFPDYVDVTPSGPAQIRNYQRQGYALIIINHTP